MGQLFWDSESPQHQTEKPLAISRKWLFDWRRRESNESPLDTETSAFQGVTNEVTSPGVPQEYFDTAAGRCVTLTDARLVSLAKLWMKLPEHLKDSLEAICLHSDSVN